MTIQLEFSLSSWPKFYLMVNLKDGYVSWSKVVNKILSSLLNSKQLVDKWGPIPCTQSKSCWASPWLASRSRIQGLPGSNPNRSSGFLDHYPLNQAVP